jgi:hypothetical protein
VQQEAHRVLQPLVDVLAHGLHLLAALCCDGTSVFLQLLPKLLLELLLLLPELLLELLLLLLELLLLRLPLPLQLPLLRLRSRTLRLQSPQPLRHALQLLFDPLFQLP